MRFANGPPSDCTVASKGIEAGACIPQQGVHMHNFDSPAFWCLIAIQATGLVIAFAARRVEGSAGQTPVYMAFYVCVILISGGTFAASALGQGFCLASGATLATMVLAATWDMGGARRPENA
jgi:hypothetical protein